MGWLCALALALPAAAHAGDFTPGSTCHLAARKADRLPVFAHRSGSWNCTGRDWPIAAERAYLRLDLRAAPGAGAAVPARVLITRLTRFDALRITVQTAEGHAFSRSVSPRDMRPATYDWLMSTPLPHYQGTARAVILTIDGARHEGMFAEARVAGAATPGAGAMRQELLLAALCGMLCLPLLFNFAFYRVLRESFLLWHALAIVFMQVQTLVTSGLINHFVSLSTDTLSQISVVSWGIGIVVAALFSADMLEPGKIDPLHRRCMQALAPWIAFWSWLYLNAGDVLRPYASQLYLASFLPVLFLFVWIMVVASSRDSRTVRFLIAACLPLMATGAVRVVSALGATDAPLEMQFEQHLSIALQVIITSLGVADRFMVIKRQRDRAREQSRVFEALAERDPLTGLLNRRAVETRFAELLEQGFSAMALLDLDRFKTINDSHGHTVGDVVLRAVGAALSQEEDTLAVRMGGEEFLLLLRGRNIAIRAERCRRAIATRIAADVPGLSSMVTASMGLVENPADTPLSVQFEQVYAHCDRLLYEAKHAGRNRMMSARVQVFAKPPATGAQQAA